MNSLFGSKCVQLTEEKVYIAHSAPIQYCNHLRWKKEKIQQQKEMFLSSFFSANSDGLRFSDVQPLHCWFCSSFCLFISSITLHFLLSHHCITSKIPSIESSVFCYSVISFLVCYCFSFVLLQFSVSLHYFVHSIVVCVCIAIKPPPTARKTFKWTLNALQHNEMKWQMKKSYIHTHKRKKKQTTEENKM